MWNPADLVWGGLMTLLIIEYARKRHMPLFILNIVLILYAVYGYMVPGMFYHAGLSWERVISATSIEMATGIFSNLPQIALTMIGSFLLVLSLLRGYGCINSLAARDQARRRPLAARDSAVGGDRLDGVGTVSGSGAANSITVGSATIPAMIGAGMPPATAAAIENASSMGGQLMPPVMGIVGVPDGRIPRRRLFRRGGARLGAGADLLHHRRDLGLSAGDPLPHPPRRRSVRRVLDWRD